MTVVPARVGVAQRGKTSAPGLVMAVQAVVPLCSPAFGHVSEVFRAVTWGSWGHGLWGCLSCLAPAAHRPVSLPRIQHQGHYLHSRHPACHRGIQPLTARERLESCEGAIAPIVMNDVTHLSDGLKIGGKASDT